MKVEVRIGERAILADLGRKLIDQRLGDAVRFGPVDEPLARVGRGVEVVADDVDALGEGFTEHGGEGGRVVGGEEQRRPPPR